MVSHAVGIICEYNPFHNGHALQLEHIRAHVDDAVVVALMSEHATQRGELAVADAYVRGACAIRTGADLVIGLPFPYSSASAEYFADTGVYILNALGADVLHFGSECGSIEALSTAASRLASDDFIQDLIAWQEAHPALGIMQCREQLYQHRYQEALPGGSNDLLAMAYLRAISKQKAAMSPMTVRRDGQAYGDSHAPLKGQLPSAGALRTLWKEQGLNALAPHIPNAVLEQLRQAVQAGGAPLSTTTLDTFALAYYRTVSARELLPYEGMQDGLAERITDSARQAFDVAAFWEKLRTKRYTDARLRRTLLYGLCKVTPEQLLQPPAYVRLLAANARGCSYLSSIRRSCDLPILTKPSDLPASPAAKQQRQTEERLEALLTLTYPTPREAGYLLRRTPYVLK